MYEYETFQAREREMQAGAAQDRLVREALRSHRDEAKAERKLRREARQSRRGAGGISGDRSFGVWGIANLHLHLR
ncbi:hypothetical protein [Streptomyces sp. SID3343]|uniref:hypothetical protein n=1 Tax=Streptomyces sp. SID3343 TaxID=2690260 RepID=UPI00136AEC13|nr:hypothetical protein [Streptomyces sp. SID3343]MYV99681.1 hypothetical protein [Streptomyces sp. SID3343]